MIFRGALGKLVKLLLCQGELAFKFDLDIGEVEPLEVASFNPGVGLLGHKFGQLLRVVLELGSALNGVQGLFQIVLRQVVVRVFDLHPVELRLSHGLVRDHVEFELLQLVFVPQHDLPLGLHLVQLVAFDALFEVLDLGHHVAAMVSDLDEAAEEPVPEVFVLYPAGEVLPLEHYFLKLFERDD